MPVVSPDGRYLVNKDSELTVWDVASGDELGSLAKPRPGTSEGYSFLNYALAFGRDHPVHGLRGWGGGSSRPPFGHRTDAGDPRAVPCRDLHVNAGPHGELHGHSYYAVTGTFQLGDGALQPVDESVCVYEGLTPQALEAQTSPITCEVQLVVGDGPRRSWTVRGIAPIGTPPVTYFAVSRTNDHYIFEVTREGSR